MHVNSKYRVLHKFRPPAQTKNVPVLSYGGFLRLFQHNLLGQVSEISYNFLYFKFRGIKIVFCAKMTKFNDVNHTRMIDVIMATALAKDLEP